MSAIKKDLDIIGFGALNFDELYMIEEFPSPGDEIVIKDSDQGPGGSAANTIIGLARLRLKTGVIGTLSFDSRGSIILKDFENHAVNTEGLSITATGQTGTVIGFVDKKGERILHVYPGVNDLLKIQRISMEYGKRARWIHLSSFVGDEQLHEQAKFVEDLRKEDLGTRFSLSLGMIYARKKLENLKPILKNCEILFCTEKEIQILMGTDFKDAFRSLLGIGCKTIAITRDSRGCYVASHDEEFSSPAFKVNDVVDVTGAGDAFAAGFLYGFLKRESLRKCAAYGNYLASRCITKLGARRGLVYSLKGFRNHIADLKALEEPIKAQ
jgi:ribokinase